MNRGESEAGVDAGIAVSHREGQSERQSEAPLETPLDRQTSLQPEPPRSESQGRGRYEQLSSPVARQATCIAAHQTSSRDARYSLSPAATYSSLPPPEEIVEAIQNYVSSYFQLGFLHKAIFVEGYIANNDSVSPILLIAICSISAAFTPSLVARYGGKQCAVVAFLSMADDLVGREMLQPSLERAQACAC